MRTGVANLPLHSGKAPRWLFSRMTQLAGTVTEMIVAEYGPDKMLERLADPRWFQAFGCVLGFDWHSSGVTTTTCGAIKEGIKGREAELGFFVAGGKGGVSRKTPEEIVHYCGTSVEGVLPEPLVNASKLSAKVDNTALQDGYQLYHHCFFFTRSAAWSVVQQGMNETNQYARRYHWHSPRLSSFVNEPHSGIASQSRSDQVLNMVAHESEASRRALVEVVKQTPVQIKKELRSLERLDMPSRHWIAPEDLSPRGLDKVLIETYDRQPASFEQLLAIRGVGPKTLRALVMVAEIAYGARPSWKDPAVYSFAHGGKDGIPYPVDRPLYDETVSILKKAIGASRMGQSDKLTAIRRLASFWPDV
ncbi:MAG: DUF763 domain-containing protein [Armatimonadetes bacterium]|nr:DUF763 domain-containing protein [Armatimonadota bacterium]